MQRCKTAACGYAAPRTEYRVKQTKKNGTKVYYPYCEPCRQAMVKRQREDKKRKKETGGARTCVQCKAAHEPEDMETDRDWCKACRKAERDTATQQESTEAKLARASKPERCCNPECQRPFAEADFDFRADSVHGAWRPECRRCGQLYRRTHVASTVLSHIKKIARERGILFEDADSTAMQLKLIEPCHYCGHEVGTGNLNRLDRVISAVKVYFNANVVACCPTCNYLKGADSISDFVSGIRVYCSAHDQPADIQSTAEINEHQRARHAGAKQNDKAICSQKYHICSHTSDWQL